MEEKDVSPGGHTRNEEAMKKFQGRWTKINRTRVWTLIYMYWKMLRELIFLHVVSEVATASITLLLEHIL